MKKDYITQVRNNSNYLYILRRTLPPWRWREGLDELVAFCPKYGIDEVCIKVDTGTFTHSYPSIEWLRNYQKILRQVKRELADVGVNFSINPNVTQGHGERGRNIYRQHPDWTMCTRPDGTHTLDCACNASKGWRDYIRQQWTIYAETEPATIWMEDDLRTFGHGPVNIGCFCPEHLRRFNERCGTNFTREQLTEQIFAPGEPHPLRATWLHFLNDMTLEVLAMCEETIHSVSPETVFGLMSSGSEAHVCEGRDWQAVYKVMSHDGKYPVLSRPPLGNYQENSLTGLAYTAISTNNTRFLFGSQCLEEGEIENFPYTGYSKTTTFTNLQNSVAIGAGEDAVTLNLYDHCGTPMEQTEDLLQALAENKPYLSALKTLVQPKGVEAGVRIYFNNRSGEAKRLKSTAGNFFGENGQTMELLSSLGFPVTYRNSTVTVIAGQAIEAATDDEITELLSHGAFIDAVAFQALARRGFAPLMGADCGETFTLNTTYPVAGEHFHNQDFGGATPHAFSLAIHGQKPLLTVLKPHPGAVEVTEFVNPDFQRLFPGTQVFANEKGGRIVLFPLELNALGNGFKTPKRKEFVRQLLTWASQDTLPMTVSGHRNLLPLRYDRGQDTIAAVYNLSLDTVKNCVIQLHVTRPVDQVQALEFGETQRKLWPHVHADGAKLSITVPQLTFNNPIYFQVTYKN